ncbi:DNA adenine methylase [Leptothoe kymatousa]|uniref:Site-specific DNA-methyltransferase (adenine-specific) n=1 Tax=Leptothoe kymatousa TAU-MAC 1615 TaxID=2364775 RepID=A0ABS5Y1Z9_9CYAN|nr:DNA adenine methylase [Leptothoe kymatousa]MBT9311858.1 DNA adenine methylase [Leptothoe kymatousa TAU-MAC 1615]
MVQLSSPPKPLRPFLKWAGGKRQLVPELLRHAPAHYGHYYEPFIGGGALLLNLQPTQATINDSNDELINCYRVVKESVDELIETLGQHRNEKSYFYEVRGWDRQLEFAAKTNVQRAARIIFLNKTCYNGLFRVNSKGQFNAPFGKYKNPNIANERVLRAVSRYLNEANVTIRREDFAMSVAAAGARDFVYFDPPYDPVSTTASFTAYDTNGFNRDEQRRLKSVVDDLTARGCKVMLSNAATEFIQDLYGDYHQLRVKAKRAINSNAAKRGKVDELLVINY